MTTSTTSTRGSGSSPSRPSASRRPSAPRSSATAHAWCTRRRSAGSPAKTQVVGPETDDFVRNRLTHSLEVAQVARDLSRALGSQPDIAETAALAHDLGHPPFGHNGERALADAQRVLRRLRGQRPDAAAADPAGGQDGRRRGPLGRAQPDPRHSRRLHQVPLDARAGAGALRRRLTARRKFGVYDDDLPVFDWLRDGRRRHTRHCLEAQVMDLADDVAYSVHDVEDGIVAGRIDLTDLDRAAVWETVRDWYLPDAADDRLDDVLAGLRTSGSWPDARLRRQPAQPGRPEEPHQRPDRPLLRRRAGSDVRGDRGSVRPLRRRPRRARARPVSRSRCSRGSPPTT